MNTDLETTLVQTGMLALIPSTTPGSDTDSFDCAKGRWTLISGVMGNAAAGPLTISLEDSADDTTFTAVSGAATLSVTAVDKGTFSILIDHRAIRRYGRLNVILESGGNTRVAITALTYHGESISTTGVDLLVS